MKSGAGDVSDILSLSASSEYAALLLYWMTHKQTGSAGQLETGIGSLLHAHSEESQKTFYRGLRKRLQWLGHAHFEPTAKQTLWRILPPGLLLLPQTGETETAANALARRCAVLTGARTPDLENAVQAEARKNAVSCEKTLLPYAPPRFALQGRRESLAKVAQAVVIPLIENAPEKRLLHVRPVSCLLQETAPRNRPDYGSWEAADLNTLEWRTDINLRADNYSGVDLLGPYPAALAAVPQFGPREYFAAITKEQFFAVPDAGSALLAAAWASGKTLCGYDAKSACFFGPKDLPLEMARVLCLCSGKLPEGAKRFSCPNGYGHENVPPVLAAALLQTVAPPETKPAPSPASNGVFWFQRSAF